jgi:hypothetical protein
MAVTKRSLEPCMSTAPNDPVMSGSRSSQRREDQSRPALGPNTRVPAVPKKPHWSGEQRTEILDTSANIEQDVLARNATS